MAICGKIVDYIVSSHKQSTSFPGFSPTRPYGARERETLVGSGHVVPEQNTQ